MSSPAVDAEDSEAQIFGYTVSDLQSDLTVTDTAITGTLKYLDSGSLVDTYGAGYFMALKFSDVDTDATSVLVGMDPSEGTGLVELLGDPDMNGAFKVTDKDAQVFKIVTTDGTRTTTKTYDLSGLTLEDQPAAQLTSLTIGALTFTPPFSGDVFEYTVTTSNATNVVRAEASDGVDVTITVNDTEIDSGTTVTWQEGENTVIVNTAIGDVPGSVYQVTVTKE